MPSFILAGRRFKIARWQVGVRLAQALGSLVTATMNGALLMYIHTNRLGLADTMLALEIMVCSHLVQLFRERSPN